MEGKLVIDGRPAIELIRQYNTPLYLFLEQRIRENCRTIVKLSEKYFSSKIFYSYKANYLTPLCRIIAEEGLGAEIATEYEYDIALKCGVSSNSIVLSSPYKPRAFLERVLMDHIGLILICHLDEITELQKLVPNNYTQPIGVRLRSPRLNKQIGIAMNKQTIRATLEALSKTDHLTLTTLQLHSGTQLDTQIFKDGIDYLLTTANQLEDQGIHISQLDFGGGFPEASYLTTEELENLFLLLFETLNDRGWAKATCIFEPGRYIIADAGVLLSQIIRVFKVEETPWIMLNTGTHHCPKFSNSKFRFELIDRVTDTHNTPTSIAGCLPTDMDVFSKRYPFPPSPIEGNYVAIFNAGAYTLTWSTHFSYPFPPILLVRKDSLIPINFPSVIR
ncbi:MAG: diaminopimelate decarboxylase family protein [Candidatus Helarchaeota archaeon]